MPESDINNIETISEEKPREIKALDTKEVSIVDKPAILREFIIYRRQDMGVFDPEKDETKEPTQKAEETPEEKKEPETTQETTTEEPKNEAILKVYENGDIELEDEKVEKGKRFTTNRISALTKSVQELLGVLASVDLEATKNIIEGISKEMFPVDKSEESKASNPEDVKKAVEEAIAEKFESLDKRLDAIEGTRKEAQSKEDSVEKKLDQDESVFKGIL